MTGLFAIGVALILGIVMRIAAVSGALTTIMMWTAVLPPDNNLWVPKTTSAQLGGHLGLWLMNCGEVAAWPTDVQRSPNGL